MFQRAFGESDLNSYGYYLGDETAVLKADTLATLAQGILERTVFMPHVGETSSRFLAHYAEAMHTQS